MASPASASSSTPFACSCCVHRYLLLLLLLLSSLLAQPGAALKWVRFNVPAWATRGGEVMLTCQFDLADDRLYSVKWYKAGREFYRFVPADRPPQQHFPFPGITVDADRSNAQQVALKGVNINTAGRYKCEVLTEAPLFKTLVRSATLTVYELPDGNPVVVGGQPQYRPGEVVNLTCLAPKSIPAATLTWYINDQQATQDFLVEYNDVPDSEGRVASRLGLQFRAREWHFPNGRVTLRCSAVIHRLYEEEVLHEGVVAPPDPLSLGQDPSGAGDLRSMGKHLFVLLSVLITGLTRLLHSTFT
ncbi:cell adhesion molecule 2-like [Panulirus ornatus]|uniref:cell adhesion molecule 2-like n=1 Tax=Panulirus ornatus TaxID=150431 RepID=UPI003A8877D0